jgi:hypothetical protein
MSDFYASWLDVVATDAQPESYATKYSERVAYFTLLAKNTVSDICENYPELNGRLFISYQNINIALGRYFNDIHRYKELHNIKTVHPSKMIAHTIKWIHLNPVLFSSINENDFNCLSETEQAISININYSFIMQCVEYILSKFNQNISEAKYDRIFNTLQYFLKTGLYQERMASLWFEEILKG